MTFKIAHISDTHLSLEKPYFVANFRAAVRLIRARGADLLINTGDAALDGADRLADLEAVRTLHDEVGIPYRIIPGNHDIGDNQPVAKRQPINEERRARWLSVFAEDWWSIDVPGWRLLGLNAQLIGSSLGAAPEQLSFVRGQVATLAGRSLALFNHKPLFLVDPAETGETHHFMLPTDRAALLAALGGVKPVLVGSGHTHEVYDRHLDGTHYVWAPGTSFIAPEYVEPVLVHKTVGFWEHVLHEDGRKSAQFVQDESMAELNIGDFPGAYGDLRSKKFAHVPETMIEQFRALQRIDGATSQGK
jgi:3',5'-cyclic AMP phosphodiesterase CpdA